MSGGGEVHGAVTERRHEAAGQRLRTLVHKGGSRQNLEPDKLCHPSAVRHFFPRLLFANRLQESWMDTFL
jgi:hypothetical protein